MLFLSVFFSIRQKRGLSVAGEIYHLVFNSNIREYKGFGLRMKMTESTPDVEAYIFGGMQSGSIRGTSFREVRRLHKTLKGAHGPIKVTNLSFKKT